MRELKFLPTDAPLFAALYRTFLEAERVVAVGTAIVTAADVQRKLDALAILNDQGAAERMQPGGGSILLENAEFALLDRCVKARLGDEQGRVLVTGPQGQPIPRSFDAATAVRLQELMRDAPKDAARPEPVPRAKK